MMQKQRICTCAVRQSTKLAVLLYIVANAVHTQWQALAHRTKAHGAVASSKPRSAATTVLYFLGRTLVFTTFFAVSYVDWKANANNSSSSSSDNSVKPRLRKLLSCGCVAGNVLTVIMLLNVASIGMLSLWLSSFRTTTATGSSTALILETARKHGIAFCGGFVLPAMYAVVAAVSAAGIWIHGNVFAAL
jgi:hypothetical protein